MLPTPTPLARPAFLAMIAGTVAAGGCAMSPSRSTGSNRASQSPAHADITPRSETFYAADRASGGSPPVQTFASHHPDPQPGMTRSTGVMPGPAIGRTGPGVVIDTSALAETGQYQGLQANTWADIGGGWQMMNAATEAETRTAPSFAQRNFQNLENDGTLFTNNPYASRTSRSGDMSAELYDHVLGGTLPREADFPDQGKNTENVRQVTFTNFGADFDPMISRDGTRVIYSSTQHRETADIYIKDVNSRIVTRLTSDPAQDVMPAISPDGQFIAFASNRSGTWDLYMMPTTGGTPVQLTNDTTHDLHPSWSPDGSKVVFSRLGQNSGRWELWVMDMHNAGGLQFIGYGLFPTWSPVSGSGLGGTDQIVFQRSRERGDRAFSIWTIDYSERPGNAMREAEIINSPTHALINPSWSPDGEFILYAAVPNSESWQAGPTGTPEQTDLWMIGNDGRGRVKLVGGTSVNLMPVWGANQEIFFVSNRSGVENLWAISVADAVTTANAQRPGARQTDFATAPTFRAPSFND